jgi:hypothetical protein
MKAVSNQANSPSFTASQNHRECPLPAYPWLWEGILKEIIEWQITSKDDTAPGGLASTV